MARHLRLEYEGAIYHVTARGNERGDICRSEADKKRFLEKLEESVEQYHIRIYAYVLMTNHYHFLFETPRGNLSAFMQQFNTSYTMYYNTRHSRTGHLFSGRYKAKLVEGDQYLLKLARYVHLNPVKVRRIKMLELEQRRTHLRNYKWSTYPAYAGLTKKEKWVNYGPLLALVCERSKKEEERYREYVEMGIAETDEELKKAMSVSSKAIGTKAFRRWVGDEMKRLAGQVGSPVDVVMRRIETGMDPEEVIGLACEMCEVDKGDLSRRRSLDNARLLTIKLLLESTGLTQRAVGQMLGMKDGSGLGRLMTKLDERLKKSRKLKKTLKGLRLHCCLNH